MTHLWTVAVYFPFFYVFKTELLTKLIQAAAKIGDLNPLFSTIFVERRGKLDTSSDFEHSTNKFTTVSLKGYIPKVNNS